jgi:hypothetical protein
MQHAWQLHVVNKVSLTSDETGVFLAQHAPVAHWFLIVIDEFGLTCVKGCHIVAPSELAAWTAAQRIERTMLA